MGEAASVWHSLGFALDGASCRVGTVEVTFDAPGRGVAGWSLAAVDPGPDAADLDGLPTSFVDPASPGCPPGRHANGVASIDHVVVTTPDLERTVGVLGRLGVTERRRRDIGRPDDNPVTQVFFRLGEVILELVGPARPSGDGPARFLGLAFNVSDLGQTAEVLGPRLRQARPAVQPGRSIATLDRDAGSSVEMAFMTAPARLLPPPPGPGPAPRGGPT